MEDLLAELDAASDHDDFRATLDRATAGWKARAVGLDGVEASLAFIEAHPDLDYGAPGALVHFAERFHRKGYEPLLLRSFARRPTPLTAWMVNRLVNGAKDSAECETYVSALEAAEADPATDATTRSEVTRFLDRTSCSGRTIFSVGRRGTPGNVDAGDPVTIVRLRMMACTAAPDPRRPRALSCRVGSCRKAPVERSAKTMDGAAPVAEDPGTVVEQIGSLPAPGDQTTLRCRASSLSLIAYDRDKPLKALSNHDPAAVVRALRSMADMMKGLDDIGSDRSRSPLRPARHPFGPGVAPRSHGLPIGPRPTPKNP